MKAKHHFWSSLAAGGALWWATGSSAALWGALAGGFLIDSDHVIDQLWSIRHGAPYLGAAGGRAGEKEPEGGPRAWINTYVRRRKLVRLPLVFHSYELLLLLLASALVLRTPFWVGLAAGYALHLSLDLIRHHHEFRSPLFYLIFYRLAQGFRRDRLIVEEAARPSTSGFPE